MMIACSLGNLILEAGGCYYREEADVGAEIWYIARNFCLFAKGLPVKILNRLLIVVVAVFPLAGLGAGAPMMGNGPTPVQSFESVDSPSQQQPVVKKLQPVDKDVAKKTASSQAGKNKPIDRQTAQMLQAELTQINQNNYPARP